MQVEWAGAKYAFTSDFTMTTAYYHRDQNAYSGYSFSTKTNALEFSGPCSNTAHSNCSGSLNGASLVADYQVSKHFDIYTGVMYSIAVDGMASGYLNNNTVTTAAGARYKF